MVNMNYTHLLFVIDRSGSMQRIKNDMEGGIRSLLDEQMKQPGELHVDVFTFDTEVQHLHQNARPDDIKGELIVPRGNTALNDAIGHAFVKTGEMFAAMPEEERPGKVIAVIVTDGMENASREYSREQAKAIVELQRDGYGWEIAFLGATSMGDVFEAAGSYGISRNQTISFEPSSVGVAMTTSNLNDYVTRSRRGEQVDLNQS